MFASKTLLEHLARGVIGISLLALAMVLVGESLLYPVLLLPAALMTLRGCPSCWLLGLGEMLVARLSGRPSDGACIDGSCAASESKAAQPGSARLRPTMRYRPRPVA